jgi:hypothetical protein
MQSAPVINRKGYDFAVDILNEIPHDFVQHEHDSPKINVWCALSRDRVIGPYFFAESTVTSHNYLDMLEMFAV